MELNYIDWHVTPFRAERWYGLWRPAIERAASYGAVVSYLIRTEADPLHFQQVSVWPTRGDFERYWASDEIATLRQSAMAYYHKPVLPEWATVVAGDPAPARSPVG